MPPWRSRSDTDERRHHADVWIESGSVSLGPVFIEGATSSGGGSHSGVRPGHHEQSEFLQRHDDKTRKLWFLWPPAPSGGGGGENRAGKCGCIGGCEFFGQNSSGVKFFEPEERDLSARKNVAVPCIRDDHSHMTSDSAPLLLVCKLTTKYLCLLLSPGLQIVEYMRHKWLFPLAS